MKRKLGRDQLRNKDQLQNNNDRQPSRPGAGGRPNGQPSDQRPSNNLNKWLILIVGIMLIVYIYNYFNSTLNSNSSSQVEFTYTEFYKQVEQKNVKSATFIGSSDITGELKTPVNRQKQYHVYQLPYPDPLLPQKLTDSGAVVKVANAPDNSLWLNLLIGVLPWVFLIGAFFFLTRRASQGQQGIFSFGKSRAKLILEDRPEYDFCRCGRRG